MSLFLVPACISLALIAVHYHSGGPEVVRPLLASQELPADVVYVLYMCWHVVTIGLALSFVAYVGAAWDSSFRPYAVAATVWSAAIVAWTFLVVVWKRQSHRKQPQWIAFLVLMLSGAWALS